MKPIHKWNNGNLATLCHQCNCIASLGHTDDLYCKKCNDHRKELLIELMRLDESIGLYIEQAKNEEPKQESCCTPIGQIKRYKDCIGCDSEPKQETLTYTEAAKKEERIFNSTMMSKQETLEEAGIIAAGMCEHLDAREQAFFIAGFIESVKWRQEQDKKIYSEEDMRKAFKSSSLTNMLDVYESFEEFIEQFKNK